jgi:hypothetical protein
VKYSLFPEVQDAIARLADVMVTTGQSLRRALAKNAGAR